MGQFGFSPERTLCISIAACKAIRSMHSTVLDAICGVRITLSNSNRGFSMEGGSGSNTSVAAPANTLLAFADLSYPHQSEMQNIENCIPIYDEDLVLIVPTNHHLVRNASPNAGQPINLEKLSGESFICHSRKRLYEIYWMIFSIVTISFLANYLSAPAQQFIEFVSANIGISIVPKMFAERCPSVRISRQSPNDHGRLA